MTSESLGSLYKNSYAQKFYIYITRRTTAMMLTRTSLKSEAKASRKRVLEENCDALLEKYRRVLYEKAIIASTKRGFRTNNHGLATYERIKKKFLFLPLKKRSQ